MKMKLTNLARAILIAMLFSASAHVRAEDCLSGLPDTLRSAVEQDHWKILSPFDIPTNDWKLWKNAHQGQCPGVAVGNFFPKTDSSFVVALIAIVATQGWFLPYQSTIYLALYHGSGELFTHRDARVLAWLWGAIVLVAVLAAAFVWRAMGLVS